MSLEELQKIIHNRENEHLEFKDWRGSISFDGDEKFENRNKCILSYCVAIGNEGGGYLIIGVDDKGQIIGTGNSLADDFKKKVFDKTKQKVEVFEVYDEERKVLVIGIPSRPVGTILEFGNTRLMRIGESLEKMTQQQERYILLEGQDDWSAKTNQANSQDIDTAALLELRRMYTEKRPEIQIEGLSDIQVLSDLNLMKHGKYTNACMLLIGSRGYLDNSLADAEICFEYKNNSDDIQYVDRVNYRESFIFLARKIWDKIYSRQQIHQIQEGLFRTDIPAYSEETFREAFFNAIIHRDYNQNGSIYITQSPQGIKISNPGGFPFGITQENIIDAQPSPRNRLLAETAEKVFKGVERAGQGADKIFRNTIQEGKGLPDYSKTNDYSVVLILPAMLQDESFIKFIKKIIEKKNIPLSVSDLILLEQIRSGEEENIKLKTVGHLLENGLIELYGRTSGAHYILSSEYYDAVNKLGTRTRRIGLSRDKCKELIVEHLRKNKLGNMEQFKQIFPELKRQDITNMLTELKKNNKIEIKSGRTFGANWGLVI